MALSLVGNHDLDFLEKLAVDNFSEVENKDLKLKDFSEE
jgi:secreted Zn-dependent insulinase-like peptidase